MKWTVFGIIFSSSLGICILLGLIAGVVAIAINDPVLGFIAGGAFLYPFGFLLGTSNGRTAR